MHRKTTPVARLAPAVAMALLLGGFTTGAAADPATDPEEIWPTQVNSSASLTALPCAPDGPTSADEEAATALNPVLRNKMRGYLNAYNISCARAVVQAVQARGLNERAAAIAIATTIVETSIANLDGGDLDSVGLFQQRATWGSFAERTDPPIATNKFLDVMQGFYPNSSWSTALIGDVAADVQRPAAQYRYRYGVEADDAVAITRHLWTSLVGFGRAEVVRVGADGVLSGTRNDDAFAGEWHAPADIGVDTTEHTRLRLADLDGDGRADLVRIGSNGVLTAWWNSNALTGKWYAPVTAGSVGGADHTRLHFADLDGDNRADLIRVEPDGTLTVWRNTNAFAAQWAAPTAVGGTGGADPTRVHLADLDGDNHADLIRVDPDGTLTAWWNNNAFAGQWHPAGAVGAIGGGDHTRVVFADLDADGKADLVRVEPDGSLTAWRNTNAFAAQWAAPTTIGAVDTTDHTRVHFADLD
ncbi:FG-GAP repeat domain-containing protein [Saccharothrix obliqua]|uniref:FG-GAP repeat domain-containing protein n=1 Tax=Saccharothrix obliqua TaxID=2861747 RepID=UPI001C5FA214|nr:VCBS repeat-containing protein [Saccharothrix obliqua]MBW4717150.1 VCBS repeat-containing protein [Saccharothrix obliqua]